MFQNVSNSNDIFSEEDQMEENRINLFFKEIFKPRNCVIYILTFLLSIVPIKEGVLPFGLAIVAACLGSTIPIFMVYMVSLISIVIFYGGIEISNFFYISLNFFFLIFIFKPKISTSGRNEIFKVGARLFFASFIYYLIKNIKGSFSVNQLFIDFLISILTYSFYKIFVNGIAVIRDYHNKEAFTTEEMIAAFIMIAISFSVFHKIQILHCNVSDILIGLLMIYIGFKHGILTGGMAGISIGAVLILIGNANLFSTTIFIILGMLSGMIGYIGKLDRLPKQIVPSEKLLDDSGEYRLNYYEEIKEKINAVAQTITEMTDHFFVENKEENNLLNKEVYIDNFLNYMENYSQNIFYEDVTQNEFLIGDFFDCLEKEDVITEKDILEIFRRYHNYILLRDQKLKDDLQELIKIANRTYHELRLNTVKIKVKEEEAKKLENELKNVNQMMNHLTENEENIGKYKKKEKEILTLLKGKMYPVRNVNVTRCKNGKWVVQLDLEHNDDSLREKSKIANIETLISRCLDTKIIFQKDKKDLPTGKYIQTYSAEDKFLLQVGNSKIAKDGDGKVSGDAILQIRLNDGKYLLAISDGMGSGEKARKASKFVINSLNTLLSKGFEQDETIQLINSELNFNQEDEMYATIDMSVLDLYSGTILMSKNGACNTYIKSKRSVKEFRGNSLPVGITLDSGLDIQEAELNEGDIIVMFSDGLLSHKNDISNNWVENYLKNMNTNNVQKIADLITNEAIDNCFGVPEDDITVIVAKIIKKK